MKKRCKHIDCGNCEQVWLPKEQLNKELKKYPYCIECGIVKNVLEPPARSIGYYTNTLTEIREYLDHENKKEGAVIGKLTEVQVRLIVKELESLEDFDDKYFRNKSSQDEIFLNILEKHISGVKREQLKYFLDI